MDGPPEHRHEHLWSLPDGTGLHAPVGRLLREEDDRICWHLCGRWFVALGPRLRVHGYTARADRNTMGSVPDAARGPPGVGVAVPKPARRLAWTRRRADARDYLRREYAAGAGLEALAHATGLGRARLRACLDGAGIVVRPTGVTPAASRHARAVAADVAAAEHVEPATSRTGWSSATRRHGRWPGSGARSGADPIGCGGGSPGTDDGATPRVASDTRTRRRHDAAGDESGTRRRAARTNACAPPDRNDGGADDVGTVALLSLLHILGV